jgi:hypothetical protein
VKAIQSIYFSGLILFLSDNIDVSGATLACYLEFDFFLINASSHFIVKSS